MSPAESAQRFVDHVWNATHEDSVSDLVADGCPGLDGSGPAAVLAWHRDRRVAFPDLRYEIIDVVAMADQVAIRWRAADAWSVNDLFGVLQQLGVTMIPPPSTME